MKSNHHFFISACRFADILRFKLHVCLSRGFDIIFVDASNGDCLYIDHQFNAFVVSLMMMMILF